MSSITRVHAVNIDRGDFIVMEDADELSNEEINEGWDASEQDWQHVYRAQHRADQHKFILAYYNGELYDTGWQDGYVWLLLDDDGQPVYQDPEDDQ
jgi:hypothetical protein